MKLEMGSIDNELHGWLSNYNYRSRFVLFFPTAAHHLFQSCPPNKIYGKDGISVAADILANDDPYEPIYFYILKVFFKK
jgi:hypothetical protein